MWLDDVKEWTYMVLKDLLEATLERNRCRRVVDESSSHAPQRSTLKFVFFVRFNIIASWRLSNQVCASYQWRLGVRYIESAGSR